MDRQDVTILKAAAKEASKASYSPYSKYAVGAAVLTEKGLYAGTNVENASYGATMCAERVALFKAVSEGARQVSALAVYAGPSLPYPCGMCLQALSEFASADAPVLIASETEEKELSFKDLLPHPFKG